ncbi:MAG: hypothetical protein ACKOE8_03075 [Opitutaceae bacterium]
MHAEGGLSLAGEPGRAFEVAGPDGVFAAASEVVVLPGNRLRVSAPGIGRPTRVRHGWQALPAGWLLNAAGLPAPPFSARVD